MRLFVQKQFGKWAMAVGLDDDALVRAGIEAFAGQFEADLGGYLIKKRIARDGAGKSGGFRTILCFRKKGSDCMFFLHGFPKSNKGNINAKEEKALRLISKTLVGLDAAQLDQLKAIGALRELEVGQDEKTQ